MANEILLNITSRDRPEMVHSTLELLYDSCYDRQSFAPYLIIDSDQVDLYQPVLKRHKNIVLGVVDHTPGSIKNCYIKQLEFFLESDSYFLLGICDDLTAIVKHWDRHLLAKKDHFKDGIFSLYSASTYCGRAVDVLKDCYCLDSNTPHIERHQLNATIFPKLDINNPTDFDFLTLWGYCEPCPVYTRPFAQYVHEAFVESKCAISIDMVVAALIQQLHRQTGISRHVLAWPDHIRFIDDQFTADNFSRSLDSGDPFDMALIKRLAGKMASEIREI